MQIEKIKPVKTPTRGTIASAGVDFYIPDNTPIHILEVKPRSAVLIPGGVKVKIPLGTTMIIKDKSSIATMGLKVGACVIDADYTGEIHFHLFNMTDAKIILRPNMKIVQGLLMPVILSDVKVAPFAHPLGTSLVQEMSKRGGGGFGSTGNGLEA